MAPTTQKNLIHETSTTTGTGSFTTSAQNGKVRFGDSTYGFGTGVTTNVFDYYISNRDAAEWERGTGHCSALGTLVRDTVIESSNANAAVSFTAGTKDITNDAPASEQLRKTNALSELTATAATARANIGVAMTPAAYTPTVTCGGGAFTTVSAVGRQLTIDKMVFVEIAVTITTNGTAASYVGASLPATCGTQGQILSGRGANSGKMLQAVIVGGTSTAIIQNYDSTYPGADGEIILVSGWYEKV